VRGREKMNKTRSAQLSISVLPSLSSPAPLPILRSLAALPTPSTDRAYRQPLVPLLPVILSSSPNRHNVLLSLLVQTSLLELKEPSRYLGEDGRSSRREGEGYDVLDGHLE